MKTEKPRLRTPIQAWLPAFTPTTASASLRRDLERARRLWQGESTVWLRPDFPEPKRWILEDPPYLREMAIPAEEFNRIDVFHIGENGQIVLDWPARFTQPAIFPVLDDWLTVGANPTQPSPGVRWFSAAKKLELLAPHLDDGGNVAYRVTTVSGQPIGTAEMEITGDSMELRWPPAGFPLPTVSPSEESQEHFGPFEWIELKRPNGRSLPVLRNLERPGLLSLPLVDEWPGTLRKLFPAGGGLDAMLGAARMVEIATDATEGALADLEALTSHYVRPAKAPRLYTCFFPILLGAGEVRLLAAIYGRYNVEFASATEAIQSSDFCDEMTQEVPVTCCLGVLGLLGALLSHELREGESIRTCEFCNRVIQGRSNKRFCSSKENPDCYRLRRAQDQRSQRRFRKERRES